MASGCAYFLPTWSDQVGSRKFLGSQLIWSRWKGREKMRQKIMRMMYSYSYLYIDCLVYCILYLYIVDIYIILIKQSIFYICILARPNFVRFEIRLYCIPKGSLLMAVSCNAEAGYRWHAASTSWLHELLLTCILQVGGSFFFCSPLRGERTQFDTTR